MAQYNIFVILIGTLLSLASPLHASANWQLNYKSGACDDNNGIHIALWNIQPFASDGDVYEICNNFSTNKSPFTPWTKFSANKPRVFLGTNRYKMVTFKVPGCKGDPRGIYYGTPNPGTDNSVNVNSVSVGKCIEDPTYGSSFMWMVVTRPDLEPTSEGGLDESAVNPGLKTATPCTKGVCNSGAAALEMASPMMVLVLAAVTAFTL
jgi:hypothetical protein